MEPIIKPTIIHLYTDGEIEKGSCYPEKIFQGYQLSPNGDGLIKAEFDISKLEIIAGSEMTLGARFFSDRNCTFRRLYELSFGSLVHDAIKYAKMHNVEFVTFNNISDPIKSCVSDDIAYMIGGNTLDTHGTYPNRNDTFAIGTARLLKLKD